MNIGIPWSNLAARVNRAVDQSIQQDAITRAATLDPKAHGTRWARS